MGELTTILAVTGYGLVVAFTTFPVVSVIAVLLGTRSAWNGLWFTIAYAAGLAVVFTLAAFGANQLPRFDWRQPGGILEVAAGVLLIVVAGGWWLLDRRRRPRQHDESTSRFTRWLGSLGPVSCAMVGFQFAFHPENLILTAAAAGKASELRWIGDLVALAWFCLVGVSTTLLPTLFYATSGERARERLKAIRDWLRAHGTAITVTLLLACGVLFIVLGVIQLNG